MGDGKSTICEGPGQPFTVAESEARKAPSCSYIYRTSSAGQWSPDGNPDQAAYPVRAVVTWAVSWTAQGAVGGGELPAMYTSTLSRVRVEQVESINAEGAQAVESVPASRHLSA
jgi:hypothetical protein